MTFQMSLYFIRNGEKESITEFLTLLSIDEIYLMAFLFCLKKNIIANSLIQPH